MRFLSSHMDECQLLVFIILVHLVNVFVAAETLECNADSLSSPCTCGSQLVQKFERVSSDQWQEVKGAPVEVFSSYLDEREWKQPETAHLPPSMKSVRTIAHGLQVEHTVNHIPPILCYVHDGIEWTLVGHAEYVRIYRSSFHTDEYTAHFLICYLPRSFQPIVAVGFGTDFCQITAAVNINQPVLPAPVGDTIRLHVCVSPLYGVVEPSIVAEFIEMYRLFGAVHFTFYNYKMQPGLRQLLLRYAKANLATIVPWYSLNSQHNYFYFDQRSALNDCLYRNAASATHLAVVDLDEFLVPRIDSNMSLVDFIDHLRRSPHHSSHGSYCFQHVYFERNESDPVAMEKAKNSQLVTQTRFSRTIESYPKGTVRSKCIHAPPLAVAIDIHSAQWHVDESIEQIVLPEGQALLHHYRPGRMEAFRKHPERFTFRNDYFLLKYYSALSANVNAAMSGEPINQQLRSKEEL